MSLIAILKGAVWRWEWKGDWGEVEVYRELPSSLFGGYALLYIAQLCGCGCRVYCVCCKLTLPVVHMSMYTHPSETKHARIALLDTQGSNSCRGQTNCTVADASLFVIGSTSSHLHG